MQQYDDCDIEEGESMATSSKVAADEAESTSLRSLSDGDAGNPEKTSQDYVDALAFFLPDAKQLSLILMVCEIAIFLLELWGASMEILDASFLVWLAVGTPEECNQRAVPITLFIQGMCGLVKGVAEASLVFPTHEFAKALWHAAMVLHYRATGEPDLALAEQRLYEKKERNAAWVAAFCVACLGLAEISEWVAWGIGFRYSFDANLFCGGPVWLQCLSFRPHNLLMVPVAGAAFAVFRVVRQFMYQEVFIHFDPYASSPSGTETEHSGMF